MHRGCGASPAATGAIAAKRAGFIFTRPLTADKLRLGWRHSRGPSPAVTVHSRCARAKGASFLILNVAIRVDDDFRFIEWQILLLEQDCRGSGPIHQRRHLSGRGKFPMLVI